MPVSYTIDKEAARIRTRCAGFTTLEETLAHLAELAADPWCPKRADVVLDLREVSSLPAPEKLRELARHAGSVPGVSFRRLAIIAERDDLVGLMRMLQVYGQRAFEAIAIFDAVEKGEAWLDAAPRSAAKRD